jgi:hypothetical protein
MSQVNDSGNQQALGASGGRGQRQKKSGNSALFNQILSDANGLSVAERVRLIKSLAGQQGLVVTAATTLQTVEVAKPRGQKKDDDHRVTVAVRPNPLKGTAFQKALDDAKAEVRRAKEELKVAKLADDHPAAMMLMAALSNYKSEQKRLAPMEQPLSTTTSSTHKPNTAAPSSKKRTASKSPVRSGSGALDTLKKAVGFKGSKKDGEMEIL